MTTTVRNISLIVNILFALLMVVLLNWMLVMKHQSKNANQLAVESEFLKKKNLHLERFISNSVFAEHNYLGRKFPRFQVDDVNGQMITTDFSSIDMGIVILFNPESCQPCLITQLKILQHIYTRLSDPHKVAIYALSNVSQNRLMRYARAFDLQYSFASETSGTLFNNEAFTHLTSVTPVVLVINRENTITHCHIPFPSNPQYSMLFFFGIEHHLSLSESLFFGHLNGLTSLDIITNNFDLEPVRDILY